MRTRWLLAAVTALVAVAVLVLWWPQPPLRGADLLPAATPVCVTFPNVGAMRARWAKSPAAAVSAALSKGRLAGSAGGVLPKRWRALMDVVIQGLPRNAKGEVFVALVGLQTTPRIEPQLALGIQFGPQDAAEVLEWITRLEKQLVVEFPAAKVSRERYFRKTYYLWRLEPGLELCHAIVADRLILTLGTTPMMEIIERYREPKRGTLSASDAFRAVSRRLPANADWLMVAQTEPLLQKLDPFVQWLPQSQVIAQPIGRVVGIGAAETLGVDRVQDTLVVAHSPASLPPRQPVPTTLLNRLPASCGVCAVADVSPHEIYQLAAQAIAAAGQREWLKVWAIFETGWQARQIDLDKDVLATLKPPLVFALDWPDGQSPRLLFGAAASKPEPLRACLSQAGDSSRLPLHWRIVNNWLWLSGSVDSLGRVADAATSATSALRSRSRSSTMAHGLPRNAWAWLYADTARLFQTNRDNSTITDALILNIRRRGADDVVTASSLEGAWLNAWLALESWMASAPPEEDRSQRGKRSSKNNNSRPVKPSVTAR